MVILVWTPLCFRPQSLEIRRCFRQQRVHRSCLVQTQVVIRVLIRVLTLVLIRVLIRVLLRVLILQRTLLLSQVELQVPSRV